MAMKCAAEGRELTVAISGEVDHHAAREILAQLERHISAVMPRSLTLDLGSVTFTDSSGIAVVVRAKLRMDDLGGRVRVRSAPPQARRVLSMAGLERMVRFE